MTVNQGPLDDLPRRVLAAVPDAVVVLDLRGRIIGWEGGAERLWGKPAEVVLGRPATIIFPPDLVGDAGEPGTAGTAGRVELVVPLGLEQMAAVTLATLRDDAGRAAGTTATVRPMGTWLDPAEGSGPPRRRWHRTLGGAVQDLVELAGRDLAAIDASEELARHLVRQARRLLPSAECLLCVVPPERPDHFHILAGAGPWAEGLVGREWAQEGTLSGRALEEGRAVETARLRTLSSLPDSVLGTEKAARVVPLLSPRPLPDGRVALGVLGFYRSVETYFTPYERRLMDEFVRLVSVTLQRIELRRSTVETTARLQTGVDVAVDLAGWLEPGQVIRRLIQRALGAVRADRATLFAVEEGEAVVIDSQDSTGEPIPVGRRFPLGALTSDGEPVLELAAREDTPRMAGPYRLPGQELAGEDDLVGLRHSLALPLTLAGSTMGLLVVARREDRGFTREDAVTLQLVGSVAALMLRNARLFEEAREASRLRSEFLNMAAHELRTPLTVINGYLSMLSDGSLGEPPPRWRGPVELLAAKAGELGRLVDDLLLTSRLESGGLPSEASRLELSRMVEMAARRARPRLELQGGQLTVTLPPQPVHVTADADHLARVLDNLVNNALSYHLKDQPPQVRLEVLTADGLATVVVEDRGRGVAPEMHERIFERFVRADDGGESPPGTGLGLYMSRQLVERHAGRVELEHSVPGEGSRFVVRLPIAVDP